MLVNKVSLCLCILLVIQVVFSSKDSKDARYKLDDGSRSVQLEETLKREHSDIGRIEYDRLHELLVNHQFDDNFVKPIKFVRSRKNARSLNGMYHFCFDPDAQGFNQDWFSRPLAGACGGSKENYHRIPVPSAFNELLTNTSALNYFGWFWYQTEVPMWLNDDNKAGGQTRVLLQLENINYLALVYVQHLPRDKKGTLVGSHVGGHLPLAIELDTCPGWIDGLEEETLRITVAVNNILTPETIPSGRMIDLSQVVGRPFKQFQPDFDFFHYAGLLGDVHLIGLPETFMATVQLDHYSEKDSSLRIKLCFDSAESLQDKLAVRYELLEPQTGRSLFVQLVELSDLQAGCLDLRPPPVGNSSKLLAKFLLLSDYDDRTTANATRYRVIDRIELNLARPRNKEDVVNLRGFGMHQEQLFSGRSMGLPAIVKDMNLLKQLGANVIRSSHYPYSPEYLDVCDEFNLMVIAECPAVGLNSFSSTKLRLHKQILREMMWRDHHHSSIIMWSVANEPQSQLHEAEGYFKELLAYARSELAQYTVQAQRPLTAALAQSHQDDRVAQFLDVIMVNRYYGWYDYTSTLETIRPALMASLDGWAKRNPGKALMVSEFGADTLAGEHRLTRAIYSEEYQRDLIEEHEKCFQDLLLSNQSASHKIDQERINFVGSMIWNFADFRTHESLLRVGGVNRKGIFTREREPKLAVETVRRYYLARADL